MVLQQTAKSGVFSQVRFLCCLNHTRVVRDCFCLPPSGQFSSSHSSIGREPCGCLKLVSPWGGGGAVSGM